MRITAVIAGSTAASVFLLLAGCSGPAKDAGSALPSAPPRATSLELDEVQLGAVVASITQQRRDQIKRVVSLRLTFDDPAPVSVTDVHLDSPGFIRQSEVRWEHPSVFIQPNVAVALPVPLAAPICSATTSAGPMSGTVTVSDAQGRSRTLTLTGLADDGLLEHIRTHDCAVASLQDSATFTLGTDWVPAIHDGRQVWRGHVDIARRIASGPVMEVTGALGSVLVDFAPMAPLPWQVPDEARSRLPIEARSSGRCDGHSMGESSKPFVFTLWVAYEDAAVPLTLAVPKADQARWWNLLASACAAARNLE